MMKFKHTVEKIIFRLLFTSLLVLGIVNLLQAQERHTVSSGETLFGISRTYDVTVENIRNWNNLSGNTISIGQVLIVSEPDPSSPASQTGEEEVTVHTVEAGQTLFRISRLYDMSVNEIRQLNNLSNDNLEVGQRLRVRGEANGYTVSEQTNSPTAGRDEPPPTRPSQAYHEVAGGETLYRISQQHGMSVAELQRLNNLSNTQLNVGQRLLVTASRPEPSGREIITETPERDDSAPQGAFITHVFGENETIEGLLSRHRMDNKEFRSLNPRFELNDVTAGDEVNVLMPAVASQRNPYRVSSNLESSDDISVTVYDPQQKGSTTTSGDLYNPGYLTAAHPSLRLGKVIYIENPANGKGIFVQINDRVTGNFLKLSSAAFNALGFEGDDNLAARIFEELPD